MLKIFRKKIVSRLILWGLLILIMPAFVMWGSASMSRSKEKGADNAGTIDGRKISFEELYGAITGVRAQIILSYYNQPQVLDTLLNNKSLIAKLAWDRLLLLSDARKHGIKVSDKDVIASIREHPLFLRDGAFDDRFYSYILSHSIGLEPRAFEEIVRDNIRVQRLSSLLTKDIKVSDGDVADEYKKEFVKLKISYILMEPKDVLDQVKLDEKAARDFYDKHKNEMKLKTSVTGAQPDRTATFEESRDTIEKLLKEVEARKMLKDKSDDAYNKIAEIVSSNKGSFEDAASRLRFQVKKTDLFSKKDELKDLSDTQVIAYTASELKDREISKPLEIAKGFMIFQVTERKDPDEESFKKEKDDYSKKVRDRKVDDFMGDRLKKLEEASKPAIKFEDIEKYYR